MQEIFREKSMFARTFFSICMVAFSVLLVVNMIVFFWSRKQSEEKYRNLATMSVSNTDIVFKQYIQSGTELVKNWYYLAEGQKCRMSREYDLAEHMEFVHDMQQMVSTLPYVQSVEILNQNGEENLSFGTGISYTEPLQKLLLEKLKEQEEGSGFAWKVKNRYANQADISLLTLYYQEAKPSESHYGGTVALHLDGKVLSKSIFSEVNQEKFQVYILNRNGMVVASSVASSCGENWSETKIMQKVSGEIQNETFFSETDGKKKEWLAMKSAVPGYYILSRMENGITDGEMGKIWTLLLISGMLLSVFVIVVTILICYRLYDPFYGMLTELQNTSEVQKKEKDEIRFLKSFYSDLLQNVTTLHTQSEKDSFVKAMLVGNQDYIVQKYLNEHVLIDPKSAFYAVLLSVSKQSLPKEALESDDTLKSVFSSVYMAKLGEIGRCHSFEIGMDQILILIEERQEEKITEEKLKVQMEQSGQIASEFTENIYATASTRIENAKCWGADYYKKMEESIKVRRILGKKSLFTVSDHSDTVFPEKIVSDIECTVKEKKEKLYCRKTEELLEYMGKCTYPVFISWNTEIIYGIQGIRKILYGKQEKEICNKEEIRHILEKMKTREELETYYLEIYRNVVQELEKADSQNTEVLMEKAVVYIRENYHNPELNVNMMADMLGISAAYCGKLFKEFAGCSMTEYLKKIRLEKAYELLMKHPEKTVGQIAEKAGFGNPAYFTTLFKKQYGVSPSKIRELHKITKE